MTRALLALLVIVLPLGATAAAEPVAAVQRAVEGFARPAHAVFREEASELARSMAGLCGTPSGAALAGAREAFRDAVLAWGRAEVLRLGPVTEANRLERVLFFPDRKGIALRQVQAALAGGDESVTDAVSLAGKSVAVQGFPALEFLLHGTGAEALASPEGAFRCRFGRAVALNLAAIAAELDAAWAQPDGIGALWANPGQDNPLFRTEDEALSELFGLVVEGLEQVRDVRLGFLGADAKEDRPKQALFWRSNLSAPVLRANLSALRDLWQASGLGEDLPPESAWIPGSLRFEFANADRAAEALADRPVTEVLAEPEARGRLAYLKLVTSSLSELWGVRLAAALGLSAGFSSLDGD